MIWKQIRKRLKTISKNQYVHSLMKELHIQKSVNYKYQQSSNKNMSKKIAAILDEIKKEYQISDKERLQLTKKVNSFIAELKSLLKKNNLKAKVMLGGSAAKSTIIRNDFDCDIFVRFDYKQYMPQEEKIDLYLAKTLQPYNPIVIHGSRDYFHITKEGINFEIVPVLDVSDPKKAINVTDMSPLHVNWILKHMNQRLRDEIVLTKLFLKANNLYGAESYIKGFSGHVVDILLVQYKTFLNLLKQSKKWKMQQVIDVEKHNTAKWLNESKISPLILIDPVQPSRNACAAISEEKFNLFKQIAAKFLKNPSKDFFILKKKSAEQLKQELQQKFKKESIFVLQFNLLDGKQDIILTKALKAYEHVLKEAQENDFEIIDTNIDFSNKDLPLSYFIIPKKPLDKLQIIKGPSIDFPQGIEAFRQKHSSAFLKGKIWYAKEPRECTTFDEFLTFLKNDSYIKEKVKEIRWI